LSDTNPNKNDTSDTCRVTVKQYEHPFKLKSWHNTDLQNDDMLLYMNKINPTKSWHNTDVQNDDMLLYMNKIYPTKS